MHAFVVDEVDAELKPQNVLQTLSRLFAGLEMVASAQRILNRGHLVAYVVKLEPSAAVVAVDNDVVTVVVHHHRSAEDHRDVANRQAQRHEHRYNLFHRNVGELSRFVAIVMS